MGGGDEFVGIIVEEGGGVNIDVLGDVIVACGEPATTDPAGVAIDVTRIRVTGGRNCNESNTT